MNERLILDISGLAHDGRGVGRYEGQAVFVSGALPGQRICARLLRSRARLLEAEAETVLRSAPDTAAPLCPHQGECGGCPLQTMPYAIQLYWKRRLVLDALSRVGHLDAAMLEKMMSVPEPSPQQTAFRNKMEFAFGGGVSNKLILGQRQRGTAEVCPTPHCVLLPDGGTAILAAVRLMAAQSGLAPYRAPSGRDRKRKIASISVGGFWRFLILRHGYLQDIPHWWAVILTSPGSSSERAVVRRLAAMLMEQFPHLACVIHEERTAADALCLGEHRVFSLTNGDGKGAALLSLPLGNRLFLLDPVSFFQVNTAGAQTLARHAVALLPPEGSEEHLLDLYCGVGAPGQLLAEGYAGLLGLEYDKRAVAAARKNAAHAGLVHCRYKAGDAAGLVRSLVQDNVQEFQAAVLDPPRSGMAREALEALLTLAPKRILYISCNPSTLARDTLFLKEKYVLTHLSGVDLFPHTPHLECLTLWRRRNRW